MENKEISITEGYLFNIIFTNLRPYIQLNHLSPKECVKICDAVINQLKMENSLIIKVNSSVLKSVLFVNLTDYFKVETSDVIIKDVIDEIKLKN